MVRTMDYKQHIAKALNHLTEIDAKELISMLEIPPNPDMGDFALPCFKLSRTMKKSPAIIADTLRESYVTDDIVSEVKSTKGYLNFYLNKSVMSQAVLENIIKNGRDYSKTNEGSGKTICIDYSSINFAKPMHLGHLLTTVIGHSLYRIYQHLGYKCVGINHLGDWGTQFGKLIVAFKKYSSKEQVDKDGIEELVRIYVKFHKDAEADSSLDDQARACFKAIEDGDKEALDLYDYFKKITIQEVKTIYEMLDIQFDSYNGEAFYNDKMQAIIDELKEKNLLVKDDGAMIVRLDDYDMPPCLVLKKDGATLYATRDIAAVKYRKKTYDFDKCLYVTAYQQNLHFKQLFKVIELMGHPYYKDLIHINYGMVSMEDGPMSTRGGRIIDLKEVLIRSVAKSMEIIQEKNSELENKDEVSKIVGIGAIVFSALKNNRIKDIVFSWEKALSFEGETAPYVQYTYARCCSLIKKADLPIAGEIDYSALDNIDAVNIITLLNDFPEIIKNAAQKHEPYIITRFSIELAKAFNKYYFEHRILDDDSIEKNKARLALTKCVKSTIKTALYLIGVNAPEKM